jgi:hypothetical protein
MGKKITVSKGSLAPDQVIMASTSIFQVKPQSRIVRTQDANQMSISADGGSCPVESDKNENLDESFQILVVGHGPAAIRWIRTFALNEPEDFNGEPLACVDEVQFKAIRFDGVGVYGPDRDQVFDELANKPIVYFTANATEVVTQDNVSSTGIGFSESIVSQEAATRVAEIIARKMAQAEILRFLPPILSSGKGFE